MTAELTSGLRFISEDLYNQIERSIPIICVDFVPVRFSADGVEVGLILRQSPFGEVWCHLGGRVHFGETIGEAIRRHAFDTLCVDIDLGPDPQPAMVYQWFPDEREPIAGLVTGYDPRKHSISLSFVVDQPQGEPRPRNEALDFDYFPIGQLPKPIWPGCEHVVRQVASRRRATERRHVRASILAK